MASFDPSCYSVSELPPCVVGNLDIVFTANSHFHPKQIMSLDFDNIEQLMFLKMNLKNVNYDYSALVLSWDLRMKLFKAMKKKYLS